MYLICATVADHVRFRFTDYREAAYMVMYLMACTLNIAADMVLNAYLAYKSMIGLHAHTDDGRLLQEVKSLDEIFNSYPMQRSMGLNLYAYAFPSTFLLPFLCEPAFAIFVPYFVTKLVVRAHPEIRGSQAERAFEIFTPMDMGRYSDILLNVTLVTLMLFLPAGFMLPMLLFMVLSHTYIYFYDRYRVLRCVPRFNYARSTVDDWANAMMVIPCGLMASCLVFKSNCSEGWPCAQGFELWTRCAYAFALHALLHWLLLVTLVPWLGHSVHERSDLEFPEAAAKMPSTWFSTNPVHCLRSEFVYNHSPPCGFCVRGREYLLQPNPAAGAYFHEPGKEEEEKFDYTMKDLKSLSKEWTG